MDKWKLLLAAALALPMLAYVAGSLAAAREAPGDRSPIRVVENTRTPASSTPDSQPTRAPTRRPSKPAETVPETVTVPPDDLDADERRDELRDREDERRDREDDRQDRDDDDRDDDDRDNDDRDNDDDDDDDDD